MRRHESGTRPGPPHARSVLWPLASGRHAALCLLVAGSFWQIRPAMAGTAQSQQLGRTVGLEVRASCETNGPQLVVIRPYGKLPDWFALSRFEASLLASLDAGSRVDTGEAAVYFNSERDDLTRAALAPLFGGIFLAELQPATTRVDAAVSGWCLQSATEQQTLPLFVISQEGPAPKPTQSLASAAPVATAAAPPPAATSPSKAWTESQSEQRAARQAQSQKKRRTAVVALELIGVGMLGVARLQQGNLREDIYDGSAVVGTSTVDTRQQTANLTLALGYGLVGAGVVVGVAGRRTSNTAVAGGW